MANRTHFRLAAAVAAMLSATVVATPALADQVTNFPGGSVHTWTGNHGEDFTVIRNNRTGQSVTTVNRHDGFGPIAFVPEKAKITRKFGGSAYDPDTGKTTTIVVGPNGRGSMVEDGNTLHDHTNMSMPRTIKGYASGAVYNPETNMTTTGVTVPGGSGYGVEPGNTLDKHANMGRRLPRGRSSASLYDPDTNMTTSLSQGPTGWARSVEPGNTLWAH